MCCSCSDVHVHVHVHVHVFRGCSGARCLGDCMWLRFQRTWAALCSSLSRAGLVAHTSVSLLFGTGIPRCYLALASLAPRIPLLRWLPLALRDLPGPGPRPGGGSEQLSAFGVDCSCYFTDNIYVKSPVEGHFDFHDATRFAQDYAEVLSRSLSPVAWSGTLTPTLTPAITLTRCSLPCRPAPATSCYRGYGRRSRGGAAPPRSPRCAKARSTRPTGRCTRRCGR